MTTREQITRWVENAQHEKATHLIVVCDTFNYDEYPIYFRGDAEEAKFEVDVVNGRSMQRVMEVYNLSIPLKPQLDASRSFNY